MFFYLFIFVKHCFHLVTIFWKPIFVKFFSEYKCGSGGHASNLIIRCWEFHTAAISEAVFTVVVLSELNYLGDSSISEAVLTLTGFLRVKLSWR